MDDERWIADVRCTLGAPSGGLECKRCKVDHCLDVVWDVVWDVLVQRNSGMCWHSMMPCHDAMSRA